MRAVLWDLLLLCLFARARGDCRGDCLRCDRQLYRDSFDVLVCILECEGEAVPRATWELPPLRERELLGRREAEDEGVEAAPDAFLQPSEDIARRPGGFPLGTRGWRPAPTAKGVQKRYGGFIGVRKSARKW
ncbi:Prepronociceptin, partial [Mesitornis unicolor]